MEAAFISTKLFDQKYPQLLFYISAALLCSSIFYLVAANWFYFPAWVRLTIPQGVLIISCVSLYLNLNRPVIAKIAAATASVALGLCLASYGQVYQTGADSYLLFLTWSLLSIFLLWLRFNAVFVLFCITSLITISLASYQLNLDFNVLSYAVIAWLIILMVVAEFYFPSTGLFLIIIAGCYASIFLNYGDFKESANVLTNKYTLPIFMLLWYSFRGKKQYVLTAAFFLSILITADVADLILTKLQILHVDRNSQLAISSVVIFILGLIYGYILTRMYPKFHNLSLLPSALCTWLAASLLVTLISINLSLTWFLFLGLILFIAAYTGLYFYTNRYLRQFLYALALASSCLIFIGLINDEAKLSTLVFFQLIICCVSLLTVKNWFWNSLQIASFIGLLSCYHPDLTWILFAFLLALTLILSPHYLSNPNSRRTLLVSLLFFIPFFDSYPMLIKNSLITDEFPFRPISEQTAWLLQPLQWSSLFSFNWISLLLLSVLIISGLLLRRYLQGKTIIMLLVFASIFLAMGEIALILILIILAIALYCRDNLLLTLGLLSLAGTLSYRYYSLQLNFIDKATYMFISGLLIGLLAYLLIKFNKSNPVKSES